MANLSLGGLISGASTDDIIQKILDVERVRVLREENRKFTLEAKRTAWSTVKSSLQTLRSKLDPLRISSSYNARTATVTDAGIATVTASSGATLTTHSLKVTQLAQTHVIGGGLFNDPNAPLVSADTSLSITVGSNTKTINLTTSDTLNSLKDAINSAGADVTAEVVKINTAAAPQYRLVLTSKVQGAAGAISMSAADPSLLNDAPGNLGFTKAADGTWANAFSTAQDAIFFFDNVQFTKPTNTVTDVAKGISLTLTKADPNITTSVVVTHNTDQLASAAESWVNALNATMDTLKDLTKYDEDKKTAGTLNGDPMARSLQTRLRDMLSTQVTGLPGTLNQLSQVGITTGAWGTADYGKVLIDKDKLKAKLLADPEGVAKVFGAIRTNLSSGLPAASVTTSNAPGATDLTADAARMDLINGDTDAARFGTLGGGWQGTGAPSVASPQWVQMDFGTARSIDQVKLYLPDADTALLDYKITYQKADGTWESQALADVTNSTGVVKIHDFAAVMAKAIRVEVTRTKTDAPAKLTELQVMQATNAPAAAMYSYVNGSLAYSTGVIDTRTKTLADQIDGVDDRIARLNDQIARHEVNLRRQFARMEEAMQRLQSQGSAMTAMLPKNKDD